MEKPRVKRPSKSALTGKQPLDVAVESSNNRPQPGTNPSEDLKRLLEMRTQAFALLTDITERIVEHRIAMLNNEAKSE